MAQNSKRKKSDAAQQKAVQAQLRKEHIRRLRNIFVLLDDLRLYSLLSERAIDKLYAFRAAPLKVSASPGHDVPKYMIEFMEFQVKSFLTDSLLPLFEGGPSFCYSDYFYIGLTLDLFLMQEARILKECSPHFDLAKAGPNTLKYIAAIEERNEAYSQKLASMLDFFAIIYGDLSGTLYVPSVKSDIHDSRRDFRRHVQVEISTYTPSRRQITVDGITRPAIRICWKGASYLMEAKLTAEQLGVQEQYGADFSFDIYIQQHALNRLAERIDSVSTGIMHFDMFTSFVFNPKAFRDYRGNILIVFNVLGLKTGYFRATIVDGVLLIRTFLFLTNTGTPEGRKLEKLTGLQMLDKKYLAIDKLSALIHSDIMEHEEVSELFRQAGCGSLLELCPKLKNSELWIHPEKNFELAARMMEYMQKGREETAEPEPID
jgi:hypothetical protein